mgnify:CR=1 FL=1
MLELMTLGIMRHSIFFVVGERCILAIGNRSPARFALYVIHSSSSKPASITAYESACAGVSKKWLSAIAIIIDTLSMIGVEENALNLFTLASIQP